MARDVVWQLLKDNLVKANDRMKKMADMHRMERNFVEGDWIFLRLKLGQTEDLISFLLSSMVHIKRHRR